MWNKSWGVGLLSCASSVPGIFAENTGGSKCESGENKGKRAKS